MRPVAVYSALRLGLFLAAFLVLRVLGVSGLLSLVIALVMSMLLSFVILRRQRDAVTVALMNRSRPGSPTGAAASASRPSRARRRTLADRLAEDAAAEDAALDRAAHDQAAHDPAAHDPAAHDPAAHDPAAHDRNDGADRNGPRR